MFTIDDAELQHLLARRQDGMVSRAQLLSLGASPNDVRRLLRRRDLFAVRPGVYASHGGRLSRAQREWVAVLAHWPAALAFESALPEHPGRAVQVAVADDRTLHAGLDEVVHRMASLAERVEWRAAPPRVAIEHATIDVMSRELARGDVAAAFSTLSRVLFSRRTTPEVVASVLAGRGRVAGREVILGLLDDARLGTSSVLERGYLELVERAHGLPPGTRQRRSTASGSVTYQDVRYDDFGLIVELDGRMHFESAESRTRDARRDLAELATHDDRTIRLTHGLVHGEPCATAARVAAVLRRLGWPGQPHRCPTCALGGNAFGPVWGVIR